MCLLTCLRKQSHVTLKKSHLPVGGKRNPPLSLIPLKSKEYL